MDEMKTECSPEEVAMKAFFLGPQAENGLWFREQVGDLLASWFGWRRECFRRDGAAIPPRDLSSEIFLKRQNTLSRRTRELWRRFEQEIPKFTPRYVGNMFSEQSLPALLGHVVALLHNPNNISAESSRVGLEVEKEAIQMLFSMFGSDPRSGVGHFTSGGTVANIEALTRARHRVFLWQAMGAFLKPRGLCQMDLASASAMGWEEFDRLSSLRPPEEFADYLRAVKDNEFYWEAFETAYEEHWHAPALIIGASAHYSWKKAASLLGLPSCAVVECRLNEEGHLDGDSLREALRFCEESRRPVGLVVSIAGTTEFGSVDRIDEMAKELQRRKAQGKSIWHHVDAAYGGFYTSLRNLRPGGPLEDRVLQSLKAVSEADSVTIDPHKLGYVPYSSGAFLCRNRRDYPHQSPHAPYIAFDPGEDPGVYSLEGSRPATGATATWLAGVTLGFDENGQGRILRRATEAKRRLEDRLKKIDGVFVPPGLDLNVICFAVGRERSLRRLNQSGRDFVKWIESRGESSFQVSRTTIGLREKNHFLFRWLRENRVEADTDEAYFVRLCLMNPFLTSSELRTDLIEEFADRVDEYLKRG
ncbi:MAG TPA: pyridoxal-dependent decarboxylase [Pseudobdellovibrionaceae bacterium]|nr:pyridoxal-dependent decarboxylase [Pseudobdellovibrionaceae bacterium]